MYRQSIRRRCRISPDAIPCPWLRLSYATSMENLMEAVGRIARV